MFQPSKKTLEVEHSLKHKKRISLSTPPGTRPSSWLDSIPPLLLPDSHILENLRLLDLAYCKSISDHAVEGAVAHAQKIHHISLAGCPLLTDAAVHSLCRLGSNLEYVSLAHLEQVTDRPIVDLARVCPKLKTVDISCEQPVPSLPHPPKSSLFC